MRLFKCRFCRADCFGLTNYTACLDMHVHQKHFKFFCPLCPFGASTKKRYHVHVKKCLSREQASIPQAQASIPTTQAQSTDIMWTCGTCDAVIKVTGTPCCEDFERVASHVRTCFKKHEKHALASKIKTDCPVARCGRSYTAYRTLCHHLKGHKDTLTYELICQAEENRLPEEDILMECPEFDNDDHIHEESTSRNSAPEENKRSQEGQEQSSCASVELRNSRLSFRESYFALKLLSKDLLPREVLSEIFLFLEESCHEKVSIALQGLSESNLLDEDDQKSVEYFVKKMLRIIGTNGALNSVRRRETHLDKMFNFLQPRRMVIGERNGRRRSEFYYIPPEEILSRLLQDEGYRRYSVIHPEHMMRRVGVYDSITSGNVWNSMSMALSGPTIVLRLYIDAFGINNPLGSSADKDKIVGVYFTGVHHHKVAAQRSSIQTLALYRSSDMAAFGIDKCLEVPVKDLKKLVENGLPPTLTGHPRYNVRVICVLGDNLGMNEIVGIVMNFSSVEHSCRRCMLSRTTLKTAKKYEEIHFKNNERRTLESLRADYQQKVEEDAPHIHCVQNESVLMDFPHLDITVATPQCYSHDLLEGCVKKWMLLILKHFVDKNWISWDSLEVTMREFKYTGSDANNRPPAMKAKKMKVKNTRKVVGTFAEVATLVRLFPQLLFDHISDPQDALWQFYLKVKAFLQYVQMPSISESQVNELDELLIELMNQRMELTREPTDDGGFRYVPPLTYKEHFLSHYKSDIENFGSLTGTATDSFEANHSPFKRIKERKRQSINVLKTLFENNERLRTYYATSTFEKPLVPSVKGPATDNDNVLVLAKEKHIDTSCFYECTRVTLHGTLYRPDRYMVRNKTEREHPNEYVFCLIKEIYVTDNITDNIKTCYLYVQETESVYDESVDLHFVKQLQEFDLVPLEDFQYFMPLECYVVGEKRENTISLRYRRFDT